jgi:hypothetical protein
MGEKIINIPMVNLGRFRITIIGEPKITSARKTKGRSYNEFSCLVFFERLSLLNDGLDGGG